MSIKKHPDVAQIFFVALSGAEYVVISQCKLDDPVFYMNLTAINVAFLTGFSILVAAAGSVVAAISTPLVWQQVFLLLESCRIMALIDFLSFLHLDIAPRFVYVVSFVVAPIACGVLVGILPCAAWLSGNCYPL